MIIIETVTINGKDYTRTYSDEGRYVVRDGVEYGEAIDPIGSGRAYYEGDVMPEDDVAFIEEVESYNLDANY